jgi:hypothetical protein
MIYQVATIHQFGKKGEKTGWHFLDIPAHIAQELKTHCKVSFRVKGKIDEVEINGVALIPMGEGDFILALKKDLLKKIGKRKGAVVSLSIEEDKDFKFEIPEDLEICLADLQEVSEQFYKLPKSHQNYYIKWINESKTETTRVKRIAQTLQAIELKMNYPEMRRYNKGLK